MNQGYMTELEGFLDLVERGCNRFMKVGGGSLVREFPQRTQNHEITQCEIARMAAMLKTGMTCKEIGKELGRSTGSVARHTRKLRGC